MNNENNLQNQNNNSENNNQIPTLEMVDFSEQVNSQNNDLFEVPTSQQNLTSPMNNQQTTLQTSVPVPQIDKTQIQQNQMTQNNDLFEVPSSQQNLTSEINNQQITLQTSVPQEPTQNNQIQQEIPNPPQMEVLETTPEIAMPSMEMEQIVLNNEKKKQSSDFIIVVIVIIMIIGVIFIDEIMIFIQNNILQTPPSGVIDANSENLSDGYITINDEKSSITLEDTVKFYNFKKYGDDFAIRLNYTTLKDIKNISEKGYYIEIYNVEKKVLYKELLSKTEKHSKSSTYTYEIILDSNVFEEATYVLAKKYNETELNQETKLNCVYKTTNTQYNEIYKHYFKFKNDMLVGYEVDKTIEIIDKNNATAKKIKSEIQNEYDKLIALELPASYENEQLVYVINLEDITSSYIPLYKKGTTSHVIEKREEYLKWECE